MGADDGAHLRGWQKRGEIVPLPASSATPGCKMEGREAAKKAMKMAMVRGASVTRSVHGQ